MRKTTNNQDLESSLPILPQSEDVPPENHSKRCCTCPFTYYVLIFFILIISAGPTIYFLTFYENHDHSSNNKIVDNSYDVSPHTSSSPFEDLTNEFGKN